MGKMSLFVTAILVAVLMVCGAAIINAGNDKVTICHVDDETGIGVVISISSRAAAMHLNKHDDCTTYTPTANNDGTCTCGPPNS